MWPDVDYSHTYNIIINTSSQSVSYNRDKNIKNMYYVIQSVHIIWLQRDVKLPDVAKVKTSQNIFCVYK